MSQDLVVVDEPWDESKSKVNRKDLLEYEPVSLVFIGKLILVYCLLLRVVVNEAEVSLVAASLNHLYLVDHHSLHAILDVRFDHWQLFEPSFNFNALSIVELDVISVSGASNPKHIDIIEGEYERDPVGAALNSHNLLVRFLKAVDESLVFDVVEKELAFVTHAELWFRLDILDKLELAIVEPHDSESLSFRQISLLKSQLNKRMFGPNKVKHLTLSVEFPFSKLLNGVSVDDEFVTNVLQ